MFGITLKRISFNLVLLILLTISLVSFLTSRWTLTRPLLLYSSLELKINNHLFYKKEMQPGIIITIKSENSFWKLSAQKSDTQNKLKYEILPLTYSERIFENFQVQKCKLLESTFTVHIQRRKKDTLEGCTYRSRSFCWSPHNHNTRHAISTCSQKTNSSILTQIISWSNESTLDTK